MRRMASFRMMLWRGSEPLTAPECLERCCARSVSQPQRRSNRPRLGLALLFDGQVIAHSRAAFSLKI